MHDSLQARGARRRVTDWRDDVVENELTPSYEDYIEAMYDLSLKGNGSVRSVDVAKELGFSKASVARATKNLREQGYINQERYGEIHLTPKGEEYGKRILERHQVLRGFLIDILGVEKETANDEACELEHAISQDTMDKWAAWYKSQHTAETAVDEGIIAKSGRK